MNSVRNIILVLLSALIALSFFGCTSKSSSVIETTIPVQTSSNNTPEPSPSPKFVNLNVKGLTLGSSLQDVIKVLGTPKKVRKLTSNDDNCGEEISRVAEYTGLTIKFAYYDKEKQDVATDFLVTGDDWRFHESVKLDMTVSQVASLLGQPWNEKFDDSTESLSYTAPDNNVGTLEFKNGRLWKARWYVNPC